MNFKLTEFSMNQAITSMSRSTSIRRTATAMIAMNQQQTQAARMN
jgi:deoxycytidylate deaminase